MGGTTTAGQAAVAGTAAGHAHSETGTEVFASLKESLDRLEAEMDLILGELEKEGSSPS